MLEETFFGFLDRALTALAREVPSSHQRVHLRLGAIRLRLDVDGDARLLAVTPGAHVLSDPGAQADVLLRVERRTLEGLLDGRLTLLDAVLDGDVILRGPAEALVSVHDALMAFIAGAARSISIPRLLDRYLAGETADLTVPQPSQNVGA
jgi:hypothetical protein